MAASEEKKKRVWVCSIARRVSRQPSRLSPLLLLRILPLLSPLPPDSPSSLFAQHEPVDQEPVHQAPTRTVQSVPFSLCFHRSVSLRQPHLLSLPLSPLSGPAPPPPSVETDPVALFPCPSSSPDLLASYLHFPRLACWDGPLCAFAIRLVARPIFHRPPRVPPPTPSQPERSLPRRRPRRRPSSRPTPRALLRPLSARSRPIRRRLPSSRSCRLA